MPRFLFLLVSFWRIPSLCLSGINSGYIQCMYLPLRCVSVFHFTMKAKAKKGRPRGKVGGENFSLWTHTILLPPMSLSRSCRSPKKHTICIQKAISTTYTYVRIQVHINVVNSDVWRCFGSRLASLFCHKNTEKCKKVNFCNTIFWNISQYFFVYLL